MADRFVLTAQVQLQAPTNTRTVVNQMRRQLKGVNVPLNVTGTGKAAKQIKQTAQNLKGVQNAAKGAATGFSKLELALGGALRQVIRYDIARAVINMFTRTIRDGVKDAIAFEREMIKVSQVTKRAMSSLKDLEKTITNLSVGLGTSSSSLVKTARVLSQTGMTAKEVKVSLEALAKTTLAPTFDDITNTTETAIAAMRQFKIEAKGLESVLGSINAVAGQFAVEAADIGVAIRRAGGAFKSAGGELNQLIALFTSVRSTTRETAETIATGFRTIFTRMQRPTTIKFLRQFGIELQDLNGKFVGPYEAVRKLHNALGALDPRDIRYSQIVEQLGGFRQVSKVIPLIQQFGTAQTALNVAQKGGKSLSEDAAKAQEALAVKLKKVTEEFKELFREITQSTAFKVMAEAVMSLASALAQLGKALAPVMPLIMALGAAKGAQLLAGRFLGRGMKGFNRGGIVPGTGNTDSVPAMLTPGEFVIRKSSVKAIGANNLAGMNRYAWGGTVANNIKGSTFQKRVVRRPVNLEKKSGTPFEKDSQFNDHDKMFVRRHTNYDVKFRDSGKPPSSDGKILYNSLASPRGKGRALAGKPIYLKKRPHLLTGLQFEHAVKKAGLMTEGAGTTGGNQRFDGRRGRSWVEVRSRGERTGMSEMLGKAYGHALGASGRKITASRTTENDDKHIELAMNTMLYENRSKLAAGRLAKRRRMKKVGAAGLATGVIGGFNTGGGVSGSDTVPALLTPGEFVFNKESASRIGYGNLRTMNNAGVTGFAKGGVVGVKRFSTGGGSGGGSGGLGGMFNKLKGSGEKLGESMGGLMTKFFIAQMVVDMTGNSLKEMAGVTDEQNQKTGKLIDAIGTAIIALYTFSAAANSAAIAGMIGKIPGMAAVTGGTAGGLAAGAAAKGGLKTAGMGITRYGPGGLMASKKLAGASTTFGKMSAEAAKLPPGVAQRIVGSTRMVTDKAGKEVLKGGLSKKALKGMNKQVMGLAPGGQAGLNKAQQAAAKSLNKMVKANAKLVKNSGATAANLGKLSTTSATASKNLAMAGKIGTGIGVAALAVEMTGGYLGEKQKREGLTAISRGDYSQKAQDDVVRGGTKSAAASGAGWGTAIGAIGGVPGMIVGAVIGGIAGAIYGYVHAVDEATKAVSRAKFGAAMKDMSDALNQAATSLNPRRFATRIGAGLAALDDRMRDALDKGDIETFNKSLSDTMPKMSAYITKMTQMLPHIDSHKTSADNAAAGFALLDKQMGSGVLRRFAELSGMPFKDLRDQITEQIEAQQKVTAAANLMAQAQREAAKLAVTANLLGDAFSYINQALDTFGASLDNLGRRVSGGATVGQSFDFSKAIKNASVQQRFGGGASNNAIKVIENLVAPLGKTGKEVTDTFKSVSQASALLPQVLIQSTNTIKQNIDQDPAQIVIDNLKTAMKASGGSLQQGVEEQIRKRINSMIGASEGGKSFSTKLDEDAKGLSDSLLKGSKIVVDAMQKGADMLVQANKQLAAAYNQRNKIDQLIINSKNKELDLERGKEEARLAFSGKDLSPADAETSFQLKQATMQGLAAPLGVRGLAAQYQTQKGALARSDREIQNMAKVDPKTQMDLIKKNADLAMAVSKTKQALEAYTNVQERTSALQTALNKERTAREKKLEAVQSFAFATDKDRIGQLKAFNATLTAVRGGLGAIPQEMRPAVQGVLKQFGEVKLPGFGGKTGNELAAEMAVDEMEKLTVAAGGQRFTAQQRKEMIQQSAGEAGLQKQILKAHNDAIKAQQALTDGLKQDRQDLISELVKVQQTFLLDLKKIMLEARAQELQGEKDAKFQEQTDIMNKQQAARGVSKIAAVSGKRGQAAIDKALGITEGGQFADIGGLKATIESMIAAKEVGVDAARRGGALKKLEKIEEFGMGGLWGKGASNEFGKELFGADYDQVISDFGFRSRGGAAGIASFGMADMTAKQVRGFKDILPQYIAKFAAREAGMGGDEAAAFTKVFEQQMIGRMEKYDDDLSVERFLGEGVSLAADLLSGGAGSVKGTKDLAQIQKTGLQAAKQQGLELNDFSLKNLQEIQKELSKLGDQDNYQKLSARNAELGKDLQQLTKNLTTLQTKIQQINAEYANVEQATKKGLPIPAGAQAAGHAKGGLIYANTGIFVPKGTDTVPAMLTPGEFVVRRAAVQAVGVDTLRAINSMGGTKHLSRGGQAGYYHDGDVAGEGLSMGVVNLDAAINRFSSEVSRLGGIFKDGMAVNVGGTIDVNVNINGGEIIDAASEHLGEAAAEQVKKGINKMLKKHFPKIARKNEVIGKQKPRGTGLFGGKN